MKPAPEKFITEIVGSAALITATHNDFGGKSLGDSHKHPDIYQVSYYLKGQDRVLIGNRRYTANGGDLFLIPPHCLHGSEPNGKQLQFEMLQVKFTLKHPLPLPSPGYAHVGYPADLLFAFHSLVNEFHMQRPQREIMMRLNLAQMILLIRRRALSKETYHYASSAHDSRMVEQRMDKVIRYLQTNYTRELSLTEIARANGYSASTLSHVFKQHVGISPIKYLINYRLSQALELMGHTDRKLEDIAFETGFKSVYHFSQLFKNRYNHPPRRYARIVYNIG